MIEIEVVYALSTRQVLIKTQVELGASALTAIQQSGILQEFPEINLNSVKIGIFGKLISPDQGLQNGDRIEIYRPLLIDPKQARLLRAKKSKSLISLST
jgi:putative ubiquitin-RnfH superfamily antitoxin RatB of RatAB toxin-antitoxin module